MAKLTTEDYLLIGQATSKYLVDNAKGSIPVAAWPDILGAQLFERAVRGGYFGPAGTIAGLDYGAGVNTVQVRGTEVAGGTFLYELIVDGKVVASEKGDGDFDTRAFAKAHGYDI